MAERKESIATDRKSKLTLSKETLRLLDDGDLTQVVGGVPGNGKGYGPSGKYGCNKTGTGTFNSD